MKAAATPARAERATEAAAPSPRAVTRGESPQQAAKVDWLNATFPKPTLSVEGFVALLGRMIGRPVSAVQAAGMLGFTERVDLYAHHGSRKSLLGCVAMGGEAQGGRWLLQIPGAGCGFVTDWPAMAALLDDLEARITRLDLAVDFLDGRHDVAAARDAFESGGFQLGGRAPSGKFIDDLGSGEGKTFYVGKAANGKGLRVYEKGRQLGDASSEWVRWEVQFGNRDRVIPTRALVDRDAFFAGAYPALAALVCEAACEIETTRAEGVATLEHLFRHLRRSYGKLAGVLVDFGVDPAELVECVTVIGTPRRLDPSCLLAGVETADALAAILKGKS